MLRWIGHKKGLAGLPNIPARDLTDRELMERGLSAKELVKTGLYEKVKEEAGHGREEETTQDTVGR